MIAGLKIVSKKKINLRYNRGTMGWTIVLEEKSYPGYIFLKLRLFLFFNRTSVSDALINGFSNKNLEGLEPNLIIKPFSTTIFLVFNVCILKKSSKVVKTFGE